MRIEGLEERTLMDGSGDLVRLDFGTGASAVASGWDNFGRSRYTPERGYGWTGSVVPFAANLGAIIDDPLTGDFHYGVDNTFRVDVANGQYDVTTIAGGRPYLKFNTAVWAEGQLAASGRDDQLSFRVDVTDGHLDLRFAGKSSLLYLLSGLEVQPVQSPLSASAGDRYSATEGSPVTLKATATGGDDDLKFAWDLDGDGNFDADGREITHTFPDDGDYSALVQVTDASGQSALSLALVSVANAAPTAKIDAPGTAVIGSPVTFRGTATDPGAADQAAGFTYAWDFGDGKTSVEASPAHTYADPGSYAVTLTVTDKDGASSKASASVAIKSADLNASAGGPYTGSEGSPVTLWGSASGDAVRPLSFSWDLDGDGTYETTGPEIAHAFVDNGEYDVAMRVTDGSGQQAYDTTKVTVANAAPTASAGGPYSGMPGTALTFRGTATDPGAADQAAGFTYAWDFGDGKTSVEASPAHTYADPGSYAVTLTVTDKDGASSKASATASVGEEDHGNPLQMGHDTIPDFGAHPTIVSAGSGPWSDPNTWSEGRVPTDGDIVSIRGGDTVSYGQVSDDELRTVSIDAGGTLDFRTDINTKMLVGTILVRHDGALIVGDETDPVRPDVTAQIVIADQPIDTAFDPEQFGTGLIAMGKVAMHGAPMSTTFMRLAAEPHAGDTTLSLEEPVVGWRVGDRLYLPDTRLLKHDERDSNYVSQSEYLTLAGVSADGKTLTLSDPLRFDHVGARDVDGVLDFLPHVANLSRNVVVESENPDGTRGHVMFMHRADVDVRYAAFRNLGRTLNEKIDNTTFDKAGNVTHIGTNQIARYPLHAHHLIGSEQTPDDGYQFTLIGNAVDDGEDEHNFRWGVVIHGSDYGLIRGNVVHNVAGSGIVTEDGSESFNVIEGNFVARIPGTGKRADAYGPLERGHEGSAFWFRGPNNIVRDNVATEAEHYGYTFFAVSVGEQDIPAFQGADPAIPGQAVAVNMNATPLREFARNEVYGATRKGITLWHIGTRNKTPFEDVGESVIKDFSVWNVYEAGYSGYPTNRLTIDGFVARGDLGSLPWVGGLVGITFGDYYHKDVTIRNADIQGMKYGIMPSTDAEGDQIIEDSYLRNFEDIHLKSLYTSAPTSDRIPPRTVVIRNVIFDKRDVPSLQGQEPLAISMAYSEGGVRNLMQQDQVFVYDYNGDPDDDFRLYYEEQAPEFVVPETTYNANGNIKRTGAPEPGLTNRQAWDKYGIAIAGAVSPTTDRRPGIRGLLEEI